MSDWMSSVFELIAGEYGKTINEVLEASRKMEASLLKLQQMRKTQKQNNADGNAEQRKMTDDEKIRKQIRLDVDEFGAAFFKLGISPENEAFERLFRLANDTWITVGPYLYIWLSQMLFFQYILPIFLLEKFWVQYIK